MEHYTVEQVAAFLRMSQEQVIDLATWRKRDEGEKDAILFPSAEVSAAVWVQRIENATGGHCDLKATDEELSPGCYDVSGRDDVLLTWDERGYATIGKVDSSPVLGRLSIRKDQLRISAESLEFYMEQAGIQGDIEHSMQTSTPSPPDEQQKQETVEELRDRLKLEGLTRDQMIYEMREKGFSNNEVGVVLGGTYKKDNNALAMSISKIYNNQKKVRNLTA